MTPFHFPATPNWLYWRYPWVLAVAVLLPLLWRLWLNPLRRTVLRFSNLDVLRAAGGAFSRRLRLLLPILRTAALLCLIIAAARPQRADESSRIFAEGIAIQMVVDVSSSMNDLDLAPRGTRFSRLDVIKDVFRQFVMGDGKLPGRPNDLIGMIRFARFADSVCPLTLDRDSLLEVLDQTRTVEMRDEDGTAIGDGLALAVERLKDLKRTSGSGQQHVITSRIAILLTDGENNMGMLTPEQAAELAALHKIKVYTILAGTGAIRGLYRAPVDDQQLRQIAEVTGGKHFNARDRQALERIYDEIDRLERTKTEERRFERFGELAAPWLIAAFILLSAQTLLDATWLRRIP